jgi:purine nucleosidase
VKIWLDTDIGSDVDDAMALAYILAHPSLELVGLSTVFGDIPLRDRIARALLDLAGADPVPVLPGLGVPLTDGRHGIMFGHEGIGMFDNPQPVVELRSEDRGPERIENLQQALTDTEPDVMVSIGPMTNIGALARAGAALPPLAIMGGKLTDVMLPGMDDSMSEWNWHCDPVAVQTGLASATAAGDESLVVPAEVTFRTKLNDDDLRRLAEGSELNRLLAVLSEEWLQLQSRLWGAEEPVVALHDPLTVAVLVEPELCTYASRRIVIDDEAYAAEAAAGDKDGLAVRAAVDVDPEATRANIMAVLTGQF